MAQTDGKEDKGAHVSTPAAAAFPSLKVGILCEDLILTGRVDVHVLLCLGMMKK